MKILLSDSQSGFSAPPIDQEICFLRVELSCFVETQLGMACESRVESQALDEAVADS